MEKCIYVKLQDVYDLLDRMYREPRYQHDGEDYYSGICQAAAKLYDLPKEEVDIKAPQKEVMDLKSRV